MVSYWSFQNVSSQLFIIVFIYFCCYFTFVLVIILKVYIQTLTSIHPLETFVFVTQLQCRILWLCFFKWRKTLSNMLRWALVSLISSCAVECSKLCFANNVVREFVILFHELWIHWFDKTALIIDSVLFHFSFRWTEQSEWRIAWIQILWKRWRLIIILRRSNFCSLMCEFPIWYYFINT